MTDRNQMIMNHFPKEQSWEENYKIIIEWGKKLPPFDENEKQERWQIKACQSPLWLKVEFNPQTEELLFTGDSEGLITKGILAIIIEFYTKRKARDILESRPEFIEKLELGQYLSAQRTNGLQALLEQIFQYARAFLAISQSSSSFSP